LRLLIKRVRYGIEAYPELDRLPEGGVARLRSAQGRWAIGTIAGNGWSGRAGGDLHPASRSGKPPWSRQSTGRSCPDKFSKACFKS
jgi:hypothetical protein